MITGAQVIGGVGVLGGTWITAEQAYYLFQGIRSRGWPSTDGQMLDIQPRALLDQLPGAGRSRLAGLHLAYEYTVQGERYVGSRSSWRGHWPGVGTAVRLARHYREQRRVQVWYDPSDPRRSVLLPGAGAWNVTGTLIGLVVAWIGWGFLW